MAALALVSKGALHASPDPPAVAVHPEPSSFLNRIVVPRPNTDRLDLGGKSSGELTFDELAADYRRLLRVVDYEAGLRFACPDPVA